MYHRRWSSVAISMITVMVPLTPDVFSCYICLLITSPLHTKIFLLDTCGTLRDKCDEDFSVCLNKVCELVQGSDIENCKGTAGLLGGGVGAFGCGAFKTSQQNACVCRPAIGNNGVSDDVGAKKKKKLPKKMGAIAGYVCGKTGTLPQ